MASPWSPTEAITSSTRASERFPDPEALGAALWAVPGVVEHGLFLGIADEPRSWRRRGTGRPRSPSRQPHLRRRPPSPAILARKSSMSRRLTAVPGLALSLALGLALPRSPTRRSRSRRRPRRPSRGAAAAGAPAANSPAAATYTPAHLALAREVMLSSGIARRSTRCCRPSPTRSASRRSPVPSCPRPRGGPGLPAAGDGTAEAAHDRHRGAHLRVEVLGNRVEGDRNLLPSLARRKHYVEAQPQLLDEMVQEMQDWTQDVSEYVMVRVRAEMGKRGHQMQ